VLAAFAALANLPESRVARCSSLYRTAPVGILSQPDFVNAVALLETTLAPEALLDALLDIEARFGRIRRERNGPRTLDLDLLLYDDIELDLPRLTLPHPRLHLRAFVLLPLAEVAPDLAIPRRGSVAAWLPAVANQGIVRL
jgi:2-amino-4-hydroxy-6-hydroxymethyldihydropteridine diphosphokinase